MDYPWYDVVRKSSDITQGDVIEECPIPVPGADLYKSVLSGTGAIGSVEIMGCDVIVLSQACDIRNEKIDSIVVSPVWKLQDLKDKITYFKSSGARNNILQGKEPPYHLLNESSLHDFEFPFHVVDFHRVYSLPKTYIVEFVSQVEKRLRLLPPYREHLSQAFARYFMRVGLPVDIDPAVLKQKIL